VTSESSFSPTLFSQSQFRVATPVLSTLLPIRSENSPGRVSPSALKILLVHNSYQQSGGEDVVFEQERHLLGKHGHRVVTYIRSNRELESLSALARLVAIGNLVSARESSREVARILRAERPDLVHVHNTFLMISPSIYEACQDAQIPVVQTLHNYRLFCPAMFCFRNGHICEECREHSLLHGVWHGCYRNSLTATAAVALMLQVHRSRGTWTQAISGYIGLTEFSRNKFIEAGLPAQKVHVKPNFVDPDPGERNAAGKYALFAGRLSPEKGVSTLVAAWKKLTAKVPLLIVGDGPLRLELEAEVAKSDLRQVAFLGRLGASETRAAMKEAAFLIVPSVWYEGFPMVIVEGFASGVPVLGSRLGSIQEVVTNGRTGLHFTAGDPSDLAEKVDWAWNHPSELRAMGREARLEYESRYTAERNYFLLTDIYAQVLGQNTLSDRPCIQ
jgi:glycosyltransferase involved in cell wall biosynthesis